VERAEATLQGSRRSKKPQKGEAIPWKSKVKIRTPITTHFKAASFRGGSVPSLASNGLPQSHLVGSREAVANK
jgi:hypothetical protein